MKIKFLFFVAIGLAPFFSAALESKNTYYAVQIKDGYATILRFQKSYHLSYQPPDIVEGGLNCKKVSPYYTFCSKPLSAISENYTVSIVVHGGEIKSRDSYGAPKHIAYVACHNDGFCVEE